MLITTQHGYRHIYSLATSGDWHGLVTCGCRSRGRGSRSCSRRVTARALGLGLAASIHQQILTTPVQSSNGKFIFLLLRTFCVCEQRAANLLHIHPILTPTNDLCVSKPGSKLGLIWCPFSFNVLKYVELADVN